MSIGCYPEPAGMTWEFGEYHYPPIRKEWGNDYGTIIYSKPLEFDKIWRYDLRPADPVERAKYMFWLHADCDEVCAADLLADYLYVGRDNLINLAENRCDGLAPFAIILLDAGVTA
jgi:hypothetical protein